MCQKKVYFNLLLSCDHLKNSFKAWDDLKYFKNWLFLNLRFELFVNIAAFKCENTNVHSYWLTRNSSLKFRCLFKILCLVSSYSFPVLITELKSNKKFFVKSCTSIWLNFIVILSRVSSKKLKVQLLMCKSIYDVIDFKFSDTPKTQKSKYLEKKTFLLQIK